MPEQAPEDMVACPLCQTRVQTAGVEMHLFGITLPLALAMAKVESHRSTMLSVVMI